MYSAVKSTTLIRILRQLKFWLNINFKMEVKKKGKLGVPKKAQRDKFSYKYHKHNRTCISVLFDHEVMEYKYGD